MYKRYFRNVRPVLYFLFFFQFFFNSPYCNNFSVHAGQGRSEYAQEYASSFSPQRKWYDQQYIPSIEEIKGELIPAQVKIRLPNDLYRIVQAYQNHNVPVSLAVACGNKELDARARIASFYKTASRPNTDDFSGNFFNLFPQEHVSENFISIDPLLGINHKGASDQRGAGHFIMDAANTRHWEQLAAFLTKHKIQISQIIFTCIVSPEHIMIAEPSTFKIYTDMLRSGGAVVNPYFSYWTKECEHRCNVFKRDLFYPKYHNSHIGFTIDGFLGGLFKEDEIGAFYKGSTKKMPLTSRYVSFLSLVKTYRDLDDSRPLTKDDWLRSEISNRIQSRCTRTPEAFRRFLLEAGVYYASIFDLEGLKGEGLLNTNRIFFKESRELQMKKIFPLYKKYYESFGYKIQFLTNSMVANALYLPGVVEEQSWKKGDYPYGERNHIALVIKKC